MKLTDKFIDEQAKKLKECSNLVEQENVISYMRRVVDGAHNGYYGRFVK